MGGERELVMVTEEHARAMVNEAAHEGARLALAAIGLDDHQAADDIRGLRDLMNGWRMMKREALKSFVSNAVKTILFALAIGLIALAVKFGGK